MNICFIGGGVMAEALLRGILDKEISKPSELLVCDPSDERRAYLETKSPEFFKKFFIMF